MSLNRSPCVFFQDLDTEVKDKYATVEQLIGQKAGGVVDAKKRAQALQQEAKELLLKASDKLQLLKGDIAVTSHLTACKLQLHMDFFRFFICSDPERARVFCFLFFFRSGEVLRRQPADSGGEGGAAGGAGGGGEGAAAGDQSQSHRLQHLSALGSKVTQTATVR